ncbi:Ada metal-binding domain-containing protein [Lactobacillus delbrueckii]|uniref:Ada metal-binding domain-containing protein n=1 Tax=Lactobacillus delbrueckii TaxID=1584 RepID=UPI003AAEB919
MDDNEMWQAVQTCDPAYDGKFFYAVQTTRIFCRPKTKIRPAPFARRHQLPAKGLAAAPADSLRGDQKLPAAG